MLRSVSLLLPCGAAADCCCRARCSSMPCGATTSLSPSASPTPWMVSSPLLHWSSCRPGSSSPHVSCQRCKVQVSTLVTSDGTPTTGIRLQHSCDRLGAVAWLTPGCVVVWKSGRHRGTGPQPNVRVELWMGGTAAGSVLLTADGWHCCCRSACR